MPVLPPGSKATNQDSRLQVNKKIYLYTNFSTFNNMKVLITGANGLIAQKLIENLSAKETYQITATSRKHVIPKKNINTFTVDLVYADINKLIETLKPDVLVHCAAIGSPDACEVDQFAAQRLNVDVTARLTAACKDYGVHLVFLSTDLIFDGKKGNYTEDDVPCPVNYYGVSKLDAEKIIINAGINAAIIRTSLVYGFASKLTRKNIVIRIFENLKQDKFFKVPFDQIRTPTYVGDLVQAIAQIIENKTSGIYNIAGQTAISVSDFAVLTSKVFDLKSSLLIPVTTKELAEPAIRPLNTSLNINKAKQDLKYTPNPIEINLEIIKDQLLKL